VARWTAPQGRLAADRVELRLPVPKDASVLHAYASEKGGLRGLWVPLVDGASLQTCTELIEDWLGGWRNLPSVHGPALVITQAGHRQLIGQVGLGEHGDDVVELVYGIAPDHRRLGHATGAARLVARWLLAEDLASEVELRIGENNSGSLRVAAIAGFVPGGTVMSHVRATGHTYKDRRFVMLPNQ
jgi:RimJ/RimL family protein N-acetyltransferase